MHSGRRLGPFFCLVVSLITTALRCMCKRRVGVARPWLGTGTMSGKPTRLISVGDLSKLSVRTFCESAARVCSCPVVQTQVYKLDNFASVSEPVVVLKFFLSCWGEYKSALRVVRLVPSRCCWSAFKALSVVVGARRPL